MTEKMQIRYIDLFLCEKSYLITFTLTLEVKRRFTLFCKDFINPILTTFKANKDLIGRYLPGFKTF